jgi:hypothetical protein
MRTKLHWMYLLPLLSLSTALSGCGSELGADPIFSTTVHLTIKPLANETSVAGNALNVAWVYRVVAANQVPELGGATTMVDCASENAQQSYCIAPSLEVTTRDVRSGQFDVKVGAPLPWVLEAGGRTVTAVIAICEASALGSPECIKYAEGVYVHYTRGKGFSLTFEQVNDIQQPVPSDSELVIETVRDLPPKPFSSNQTTSL